MTEWVYTYQSNNWDQLEDFINGAGPKDSGGILGMMSQSGGPGGDYNIHVWVRKDQSHTHWHVRNIPWANGESVKQQLEGMNFTVLAFYHAHGPDSIIVATRDD